MRKAKAITPKRRLIKKAALSLMQMLWLKAAVACSRHDEQLQKEIKEWPESFCVLFKVFMDKPCLGLRKSQGSLHIIQSDLFSGNDVLISFKSLDSACSVFSGKTSLRQAFTERRFDTAGDPGRALFAIRVLIMAEHHVFRKKGIASRLAILSEILRIKLEGKEVSSCDSEILRVS